MDATRSVGLVLVAVGLLAGTLLVAHPFVVDIAADVWTLGLLFLACLSVGVPLHAGGSDRQRPLRLVGTALLALGLAALIGIFADAAGLHAAERSPAALWLLAPLCLGSGLLLGYFAGALDRLGGKAR